MGQAVAEEFGHQGHFKTFLEAMMYVLARQRLTQDLRRANSAVACEIHFRIVYLTRRCSEPELAAIRFVEANRLARHPRFPSWRKNITAGVDPGGDRQTT